MPTDLSRTQAYRRSRAAASPLAGLLIVVGDRVVLQPATVADIAELRRAVNAVHGSGFIDVTRPHARLTNRQRSRRAGQDHRASWRFRRNSWRLLFVARELVDGRPGRVVGECDLGASSFKERREVDFGVWGRRKAQGRGLFTAASVGAVDFVLRTLQGKRVRSIVALENHPSRGLHDRLGFTEERQFIHDRGTAQVPSAELSMRRADWQDPLPVAIRGFRPQHRSLLSAGPNRIFWQMLSFVDLCSPEFTAMFETAQLYEKKAEVWARRAIPGEEIITVLKNGTVETRRIAKDWEWVVTNLGGEQQLVSRTKFNARYTVLQQVDTEFLCEPRGKVRAIPNPWAHSVVTIAPWGEVQLGKYDCMFAMATDRGEVTNDRYIIGGSEFRLTYEKDPWDPLQPQRIGWRAEYMLRQPPWSEYQDYAVPASNC